MAPAIDNFSSSSSWSDRGSNLLLLCSCGASEVEVINDSDSAFDGAAADDDGVDDDDGVIEREGAFVVVGGMNVTSTL